MYLLWRLPVDYKSIGANLTDLGIIELVKDAERRVANLYKLPPVFTESQTTSTFNNASTFMKSFYTDVVLPELNELIDGLNEWLVPAFGDNLELRIDVSDIEVFTI